MTTEQNIFSLVVYNREASRETINMFLCAAAAMVRGPPDEYEDPMAPTVGPCAGGARVHWDGMDWTLEDFLSLLVDADANQRAAQYVLKTSSLTAVGVDYHDLALLVNNIQQQPHLRALYACPILGHVPSRDFLKHYLFWFAVQYDTRVARLVCRINNMLLSHGLGCPTPTQNLALHDTLAHILPLYAQGKITAPQFRRYVWDAYCFALRPHGTTSATQEDEEMEMEVEDDDPPQPHTNLFDLAGTRFKGTSSYFVVRKDAFDPSTLTVHYIKAHEKQK